MTAYSSPGIPRGIRNKNPLNIRRTKIGWQGKAEIQSDPEFETFVDPHHGIRAAAKNLLTYYRRDKLNTVQEIVSKWAPPEDDNDTGSYISAVSERMKVTADTPLDLENAETLASLVTAMMIQEVGSVPYDGKTISLAVAAAYSSGTDVKAPAYIPTVPVTPVPVTAPPAPLPPITPAVTANGEKVAPPLVDQPSSAPTRKVTAGTIGAMGGLPVAWFAKVIWDHYVPLEPMPVEIAIAIAAAASSAGSYLLAYYTRNRATAPIVSN
jgi:hypothetical protein